MVVQAEQLGEPRGGLPSFILRAWVLETMLERTDP